MSNHSRATGLPTKEPDKAQGFQNDQKGTHVLHLFGTTGDPSHKPVHSTAWQSAVIHKCKLEGEFCMVGVGSRGKQGESGVAVACRVYIPTKTAATAKPGCGKDSCTKAAAPTGRTMAAHTTTSTSTQ
jgi:hypothetical protein